MAKGDHVVGRTEPWGTRGSVSILSIDITYDPKEINKIFRDFYKNLYS